MPAPEPRAALRARKALRPHPASPAAAAVDAAGRVAVAVAAEARDAGTVMFCVRVPRSLRRRVKIAAAEGGTSVQDLGIAALEAECRRRRV